MILATRECKYITCDEPEAFGSDYCIDHATDVVFA